MDTNLVIWFVLLVLILYLVIRILSRKNEKPEKPAQKTYISAETGESKISSEQVKTEPQAVTQTQSTIVKASGDWHPMTRAELEIETLWRLEHLLRELPDPGQQMEAKIDFSLEPRELARSLGSNPFYAAKLLKTVNSAAIGLRQRITSVQRAITYLGYNQVKNIVIQHSIRAQVGAVELENSLIDQKAFWRHSHAVSVCCDHVFGLLDKRTSESGTVTTAALLHDIGWVIFPRFDRNKAAAVFRNLAKAPTGSNTLEIEQETGFNHLVAGRMLAESWSMAPRICELIGRHHDLSFGFAEDTERGLAREIVAIALAENMAAELGYANPLAEPHGITVDIHEIYHNPPENFQRPTAKLREELSRTMKFIDEFFADPD